MIGPHTTGRRVHVRGMLLAAGVVLLAACSSDSSSDSSTTSSSGSTATTSAGADTATTAPVGDVTTTAVSGGPDSLPEGDETASTSTAPTSPPATAATADATTVPDTAPTDTDPGVVGPTSSTPPDPTQLAFPELGTVSGPVDLAYRNGDPKMYIVSVDGFIVSMLNGEIDDARLLDITGEVSTGNEQGLLGLTFSVDGTHAYVNYTNVGGDTEIVEYAVGGDGVFDPASKRLLLEIDQPYSNHNGGQVRIGPDGYLYIGMGDGGSGGDPERRALNVDSLLGKMLRIDPTPSGDVPYSIPADNPFVGVAGARPEIYSVGLRNPWRYSFDVATDDLWIADVGQGNWEEIDVAWADDGAGKGANFGWSAFEGTHRFNDDQPDDGVTMPIHEYNHDRGDCSVSGGVRYRGNAIPSLYGWYVYADYCTGELRAFPVLDDRTAGEEVTLTSELGSVSAVAQGPDDELYVLSLTGGGTVYAVQFTG